MSGTTPSDSEVTESAAPAEKVRGSAAAGVPKRSEVVEQLERILKSPAFNKSQRYSAFLRYCVERALDGKSDLVKERSIGVDVFDRRPDYDPGTDHVVRSAAAEVRRRLPQYYQDHADAGELRIEVVPGSYVPQFSSAHTPAPAPAKADLAVAPERAPARRMPPLRRTAAAAAVVLAAALLLLLWYRPWRVPTGAEWFWSPLLSAPKQVTIFIGPAALVSTEPRSVPPEVTADTSRPF